MKSSLQSISVILAAGAAGVALYAFANSAFAAALPADVLIAVVASLAVVGFAAYDYSRRVKPLALPVRLLRPSRPVPARACCDHTLAA